MSTDWQRFESCSVPSYTRVVGYAFDADVHCCACAREALGDSYGDPDTPPTDSEGNTPSPIFQDGADESAATLTLEANDGRAHHEVCGTCGEELDDYTDADLETFAIEAAVERFMRECRTTGART